MGTRFIIVAALVAAGPIWAQEAGSPTTPAVDAATSEIVAVADAPAAAPAGAGAVRIPARTVVEIAIVRALGSKISVGGEKFPIRLAEDVVVDGVTVLPAGLTGEGEVVHAAKARMLGKAGELVLAARYLDCGPTRIPLGYFKLGVSGNSRTMQAMFVPVVGMFISGGHAEVQAGERANAQTRGEIEIPGPAATACPAAQVTTTAAAGEVKP